MFGFDKKKEPRWSSHDYEYDENRLVFERTESGMATYYTYHPIYINIVILIERINILPTLKDFYPEKVTTVYDEMGNKIKEYNSLGGEVEYYYDSKNRLTRNALNRRDK